ncbi:acyl-CoA dehydrogenase [Parahaliea maris]|uniref:Acyl-CoA dehydrogenase n=1 Tax=Parahaliea maris TaxID=2716870 RepID=A0A5C9A5F1_9GAMM|nr:acyl-CoA dehydrogenase family protein [Parahaliea maris]TXS96115.1 acyl-CoA dehydrogenase [Parahaliea maris]
MEELEAFRRETRTWLEENCPDSERQPALPDDQYWGGRDAAFPSEGARVWFERMRDKHWIAPEWPSAYGGGGLSPEQAHVLKQELKRIRARPPLCSLGLWMLGPALLEFGSEEQKLEHLPSIVRGEIRWCQGYSEPGSGSDLASVQTRAEDRGDHFLVNGSKIWTTGADKADCIFCLVRTDPGAKKQEGISFLLIDMASDGVSATPIELISGESEFCQTFFDDVLVPKSNLVGEINKGWSIAKALLVHERKLIAEMGTESPRKQITPTAAAREYLPFSDGRIADAHLRAALVDYEMLLQAIALTHMRCYEEKSTGTQSAAPLIMKYVGTELEKAKSELLLAIMGSKGLGWEGEGFSQIELDTLRIWAFSKTLTIAGGTSEIQLNVLAKRVLGLPQS